MVTVRVIKIDPKRRRIGLSLRRVNSQAYADFDWKIPLAEEVEKTPKMDDESAIVEAALTIKTTIYNNYTKVSWPRFLSAPDENLLDQLYIPGLSRAFRYDRSCTYFSSRVLSTAARGFGGLIQNLLTLGDQIVKPAIRLLVNEQLDQKDVDHMLVTGDQRKLIDHLLKRFKNPTDALEKNRLEMLTWLVASGWLEVKVGLMARTGGLAHAKYGILTDRQGNRIAFMGSDNETDAGLVENYEELEICPDWVDKDFVDYYQGRFVSLWKNEDPNVEVIPLPDAVRLKLIHFAPERPPEEMLSDLNTTRAALMWHFIAAAPYMPQGEYACDATTMVQPWPHQRRVVEDSSRSFPAGRLLCDEVGMGKTIEAILILRRLLSGRGVQRALLLIPAGLLKQWQDELREKGALLVPRWEDGFLYWPDGRREKVEAAQALAKNNVLLLSREWARLNANREIVLSAPAWDLVLLDEAHAARRKEAKEGEFNSGNLLLELMRELQIRQRTRGILMLSATPMQTQPWEPWDLLSILGIGGNWIVQFEDIRQYYQGIQQLRDGELNLPAAQQLARMVVNDTEFPLAVQNGSLRTADDLADKLTFAFSTEQATLADWLRKGAPLGQRMHRNTRGTLRRYYAMGLLESPPPTRKVYDEIFDYQDDHERSCYEAIKAYIDERYAQLEKEKTGKGFVMTIYRRRATSSPLALRCSLMRRKEKVEKVTRRQSFDPL